MVATRVVISILALVTVVACVAGQQLNSATWQPETVGAAECLVSDISSFRGSYGDPRDGAFGWANLLGVACSGACHEAALRWGGAVGAGTGVSGPEECVLLCKRLPGCATWTYEPTNASCTLLARLEGYPVLRPPPPKELQKSLNESTSSGPADACAMESWVEPWDGLLLDEGLALEAAQAGCGLQGLAYGEASAGACSDAAVVGVAGPTAALHLGVAAGWWSATLTEAPDAKSVLDVRGCAARCNATSACAAFSFGPLLTGDALCVLRGPLDCRPAYGWRAGLVSGPTGAACSPSSAQASWLALQGSTRDTNSIETAESVDGLAGDEEGEGERGITTKEGSDGDMEGGEEWEEDTSLEEGEGNNDGADEIEKGREGEGERDEDEGGDGEEEGGVVDPFFVDALAEPFFRDCGLPRCREPHMRGALLAGATFVPSPPAHCAFHFASRAEMLAGMAGRWQLLAGGSNAALLMRAWANALTPGLLRPFVNGTSLDSTSMAVADVVWDAAGKVVWVVPGASWAELGIEEPENEMSWRMQAELVRALERAPAAPGGFRLTLVLARFWQPVGSALQAVHATNGPWRAAPKGLISMVSIWYVVCGVWWKDWPACRRMGLVGKGVEAIKRRFADDLQNFLEGPASYHCDHSVSSYGCYLATHTHSDAETERALAASLRRRVAGGPASVTLLALDDLSLSIPSEMVGSHLSNVLSLWAIQIFLNTVVNHFPFAPTCPVAVRFTRGCHQETLANTWCEECQCGAYHAECSDTSTSPCTDWECASDRPCSYTVAAPAQLTRATTRHGQASNHTLAANSSSAMGRATTIRENDRASFLIHPSAVAPAPLRASATTASLYQSDREVFVHLPEAGDTRGASQLVSPCRRLWCGSTAAGWVLALLSWIALCGVTYWSHLRKSRGNSSPSRLEMCVQWRWNPEARYVESSRSGAGDSARNIRRAVAAVALGDFGSERPAEGRRAVVSDKKWMTMSPPRRHTAEELCEITKGNTSMAASKGVHKRRHTLSETPAATTEVQGHKTIDTSLTISAMLPCTTEEGGDGYYTPRSATDNKGAMPEFDEEGARPAFFDADDSYAIDMAVTGDDYGGSHGSDSASVVEMGSCRSSAMMSSCEVDEGIAVGKEEEEEEGEMVVGDEEEKDVGGLPMLLFHNMRHSFPTFSAKGIQWLHGMRSSFTAATRSDPPYRPEGREVGGGVRRSTGRSSRLPKPRRGQAVETTRSTGCLPSNNTMRQSTASMGPAGGGGASTARAVSRSASGVPDRCSGVGAALGRRVTSAVATGRSLGCSVELKCITPALRVTREAMEPAMRRTRDQLHQIGTKLSLDRLPLRPPATDGVNEAVAEDGGEGQEAPPPVPETRPAKSAERIPALGFARMLASLHIVLGHLYAKGALRGTHMFGWGFTWVPWFFMLSGYVLTHARLGSANPSRTDPPLTFLWKRTSNIFPLYALGVVLSAMLTMASQRPLPPAWILVLQSWLLQAWAPNAVERCLQTQCWFLSAMILYWLLFGRTYSLVRRAPLPLCLALLATLSLLPWLFLVVPALHPVAEADWYAAHRFGSVDSAVDLTVTFLKFHPLCYAHVFLFGMLLARARMAAIVGGDGILQRAVRAATRYSTTAGYAGLLIVFAAVSPANHKLSARTSILLPLQGMVLAGLTSGDDPLAAAFARAPAALGEASYAQYVLQFIMYDIWPVRTITNPSFFATLLATSLLAVSGVQEPCRSAWMAVRRGWHVLAAPVALSIFLLVAAMAYTPSSAPLFMLPAWSPLYTPYGTMVGLDVRLNLSAPASVISHDSSTSPLAVINPSLALHAGRLSVAARAHGVSSQEVPGSACSAPLLCAGRRVTQVTRTWDSRILLASFPSPDGGGGGFFGGWDPSAWGLGSTTPLQLDVAMVLPSLAAPLEPWDELCQPASTYLPSNSTLVRKVVTGAEDPKLLHLPDGRLALTFNSLPPTAHGACPSSGAVQQMYISTNGGSGDRAAGVRLTGCGDSTRDEKNWIAFTWRGQLLYVYSLWPHRVVAVRPADGACVERWTSWYSPLERAARRYGVELHGSGTASLVASSDGAPAYYVALLHFRTDGGIYSSLAYKFASEPPFSILSVSPPLPLLESERAFASGLLLTPDTNRAVVTYGVDDTESRALVMDADFFLGEFFNGAPPGSPLLLVDSNAPP